MNVIDEYYLNTTCPPGHHHNGFMATGILGTPMYGWCP